MDFREQFEAEVLKGKKGDINSIDLRDYTAGTGESGYGSATKGKSVVNETISTTILKAVDKSSDILSYVNTVYTGSEKFRYVVEKDEIKPMALTREGGKVTPTDSEFIPVNFSVCKAVAISKFTREMWEDVNFNAVQYIAQRSALATALTMEKYLIDGTGQENVQPQGLLKYDISDTAIGGKAKEVECSVSGAITYKDICDAFYNLPFNYRKNSVFICHPDTAKLIAGIMDGDGEPMFEPDGYAKGYINIFGRPVLECEFMPKIDGTSKCIGMWVDLSQAITLFINTNANIRHLSELYASSDMFAIQSIFRFDSKITVNSAISAIKSKA